MYRLSISETTKGIPVGYRHRLDQTSPICLHLDKNRQGPTKTMATPSRPGREPSLPLRLSHHTIRRTHSVRMPTPLTSATNTHRKPTIMGGARLPLLDQDRPKQERRRGHSILYLSISSVNMIPVLIMISILALHFWPWIWFYCVTVCFIFAIS